MESSIWDLEDFKFGFVRSCINIGESKTGFSLFQLFFFLERLNFKFSIMQ